MAYRGNMKVNQLEVGKLYMYKYKHSTYEQSRETQPCIYINIRTCEKLDIPMYGFYLIKDKIMEYMYPIFVLGKIDEL